MTVNALDNRFTVLLLASRWCLQHSCRMKALNQYLWKMDRVRCWAFKTVPAVPDVLLRQRARKSVGQSDLQSVGHLRAGILRIEVLA